MSSLTPSGRWVAGMLFGSGMISVLSIFMGSFRDETVFRMAIFQILFALGTGAAWLTWQYRTHARLHALQMEGLSFSPGASIGWWFVPFLNLYRPYLAMKEIWQASGPPATAGSWKERPVTPILLVWWIAFIGSSLVGNLAARAGDSVARSLGILSDLGLIAAAVLAFIIVREVDRRLSIGTSPTSDPKGFSSMLAGAAIGAVLGALIWWLLLETAMSGANRGFAFGPGADPEAARTIEATFLRMRIVGAALLGGVTGLAATLFGEAGLSRTMAASGLAAVGGVLLGNTLVTTGVFGGYLYDLVPSPFNPIGAIVAAAFGAGAAWAGRRALFRTSPG